MRRISGRRARASLAAAGVVAAAAVVVPAAVAMLLGGGPPPWVSGTVAGGLILLGLLAGATRTARRHSSRALVTAAAFGGLAVATVAGLLTVLLVLGRVPVGSERVLVDPAIVAILLVATFAGPLGRVAARATRSALVGLRRTPDELLADFGDRSGAGTPVDELLRGLAESMRRSWRLSRVELWTGDGGGLHRTLTVPGGPAPGPAALGPADLDVLSRAGVAGPGWLRLWLPELLAGRDTVQLRLAPAVFGGHTLALVVMERPLDADPFRARDERALAEVARRLAVQLRNRALDDALQSTLADLRRTNADLQASRTRLVTTADAERRRLERDLHDGAQQHLVALAVGLKLLRDGLEPDQDAGPDAMTRELLDELDVAVRESIDALRDLAHGIYPPLLRDAGLPDALRAAARRNPLDVTVRADGLGRHPEQVEAAVYFCVLEALQNAAKHAPGSRVVVDVARVRAEDSVGPDGPRDEELRFTVADDGPGLDPARAHAAMTSDPGDGAAGVGYHSGLQNMADRLGALGGSVSWTGTAGGGTTVLGRVPAPVAGT